MDGDCHYLEGLCSERGVPLQPSSLETARTALGAGPWQVFGLGGALEIQVPRVLLPSLRKASAIEPSFPLTAAGQRRIRTGFPIRNLESTRLTLE
jgi:hypothetical protein